MEDKLTSKEEEADSTTIASACSKTSSKIRTKTWWTTYISPTVPASEIRNHMENENTFWAWYSAAWTMLILATACDPRHAAVPYGEEEKSLWQTLVVCLYALSIVVTGVSAYRFFTQQNA